MADNGEWELVGGVYRRKPKPPQDNSWIAVIIVIAVLTIMVSSCS